MRPVSDPEKAVSAVTLQRADASDAEQILQMQKASFAPLLERYQDYDLNPANETADRVRARLMQPETYYYYILVNGEAVGAIRIVDAKDGSRKRISPLFVLPEYRGRGFAQAALREAERLHGSGGWALDTILEEEGNCRLYEKMGYHQTGQTRRINERMTLVDYEKP